jgi:hypothetical protein
MLHHDFPCRSRTPGQPIRVLIESDRLARATIEHRSFAGADVTICSGPGGTAEYCPLVGDGRCPLGECDVVVSSLDGPWADAVQAAWVDRGTVATQIVDDGTAAQALFDQHLGAAVGALFRRSYGPGTQVEP